MTSDDDRIAYLAGAEPGALGDTERSDLDDLRGMLSDPALWAEPPAGLEDAVVAAVTAATAAPPKRDAAPVRSAPARRTRWLRPTPVIGAAAVVAAFVVATAVVVADDGSRSEQLSAALASTERAPGVVGEATFTRTDSGWRIELEASDLPRLDGDRYYQAWLEGDDGALVAVGSFNDGDDVVLWAGVSPVDHPTISITEETADGNAASSGREVLVGSVTDP